MKIQRWHMAAAAVVILLGALWIRYFWFTEVFHTSKRNDPNRAALLRIRDALNVGAAHSDALAAYWSNRTDELILRVEQPTNWTIQTPMEFGASDWNLFIEFQDGKVSGVKVRTSDGPRPKHGPPDKSRGAP